MSQPKRKVSLVPIPAAAAEASSSAMPIAKEVYKRAMNKIGPDGLADIESRLAASQEVEDEVVRGGKDNPRSKDANVSSVRLCDKHCPYRVGGQPGCDVYQMRQGQGVDIDGGPCERDLLYLQKVKKVLEEGNEDAVRSIAGEFTGMVLIQIRKLFDSIIADGGSVEEPIFDAKGSPIFDEVAELDAEGNVLRDKDGRVIYRKVIMKRKKEHPLFGRLTQLLKETRLINLAEWQLTPKSSGTPPPTEGMILLEEEGGGRKTTLAIQGQLKAGMDSLKEALKKSQEDRVKDPAYIAVVTKSGGAPVANRGSV